MPEGRAPDVHAGLAAVEPGDGALVAMYGGQDYLKRQINSATDATMQAGSTFKPFALIAAPRSRASARKTKFNGNSPQYFTEFGNGQGSRANDELRRRAFGQIDLRRATAQSVNTVFVGSTSRSARTRHARPRDRGRACRRRPPASTTPSPTSSARRSPHVIDMANAYATIAAQGERATPYLVKKVTAPDDGATTRSSKQTKRGVRRGRGQPTPSTP